MKKCSRFLFFILFSLIGFHATVFSDQSTLKKIKQFVDVGIVQLQDDNGNFIFNYKSRDKFIPASIQKITLSLIAMEILGADYRFETKFFINKNNAILVKGGGDPLLISEEIHTIAQRLKQRGINEINQFFIDDSRFSNAPLNGVGTSLRPYDARNGALVVNFNTINLFKNQQGQVISGETQTPLTPLAQKKGNILKNTEKRRFNLSLEYADSLQYSVELIQAIFQQNGIKIVSSDYQLTDQYDQWDLLYTHQNSKKLDELIRLMLQFSNNYIANQITMQLGGVKYGFPTDIEKGRRVLTDYLQNKLKIDPSEFYFEEGSGISRKNRITATAMFQILQEFKEYHYLLQSDTGVYFKSGTLKGIYNYAGYLERNGRFYPYLIVTYNKKHNNRDTILQIINNIKIKE